MPKDSSFFTLESRLTQGKIPGLDGIRAIAITLVAIDHLHFRFMRAWGESLGRAGVTLFFVLSGFLITWLLLKEDQRTGDISLKKFYIRRFLRIFPGFYFFWIVYVGLAFLAHKHVSWGNCIAALLYVSNYYWPLRGGGDGAMLLTWSLGVEEQFYIVWPSIFKRLRGRLDTMTRALVTLCALVLLHRFLLVYVWHASPNYLYAAFDARMDSLAIGCLLAVALRTGKAQRFVELVCSSSILPALTFLLLAVSMSVPAWGHAFPYWDLEGFTIESILSAALIVQMVVLGSNFPWTWINWRWVRFIGTVSYSWYLYNAIGPDAINHSRIGHTWLRAPLGLAAGLGLAIASYYIIEMPFLRLKAKYETPKFEATRGGEAKVVRGT